MRKSCSACLSGCTTHAVLLVTSTEKLLSQRLRAAKDVMSACELQRHLHMRVYVHMCSKANRMELCVCRRRAHSTDKLRSHALSPTKMEKRWRSAIRPHLPGHQPNVEVNGSTARGQRGRRVTANSQTLQDLHVEEIRERRFILSGAAWKQHTLQLTSNTAFTHTPLRAHPGYL